MPHLCHPSVILSVSSNGMHLRRSKNNIPKARLRTLKMSIVIVLSFIICWTPYYLLGLWYWFSPDDLEGKVSHSLTHILFIFGLFNACLDPVIYGLFTIHSHKGFERHYRNATVVSDPEGNSAVTGSFRCSATSLPLKRQPAAAGSDRPEFCGVQREGEARSANRCYLTVYNDAEKDPDQSSPENMI